MCQTRYIAMITAIFAFCSTSATAQEESLWTRSHLFTERLQEEAEEEIETDRDSFTPATSTVSRDKIMVESAWSYIDNRDAFDSHSLPELLFRVGATDWLELRLGTNHEVGGESSAVSGSTGLDSFFDEDGSSEIERETSFKYGIKAALTAQSDWLPESALIVQASTPLSGVETSTSLVTSYVVGWEFENGWVWDSAMRYGFSSAEGDHFNQWAPSTVVKIPVGERFKAHAEYFGIFSDNKEQEVAKHFFSPGVHYLVNKDLEVGVRVGWGLNDQSANFFSNIGIGWQF